jgi:hypothetical protein
MILKCFLIVLSQAVKRGKDQGFDVVLCDTSGRKYTAFMVSFLLLAWFNVPLSGLNFSTTVILCCQVYTLITA